MSVYTVSEKNKQNYFYNYVSVSPNMTIFGISVFHTAMH